MNWYQRHLGDYAKDTGHLSLLEHGVYNVLIDWCYNTERDLPLDLKAIHRICRARTAPERSAVNGVVAEFFTKGEQGYSHKRIDLEIGRTREKSDKARRSAMMSPHVRQKINRTVRQQRIDAARELGRHSKEEWQALLSFCKSRCCKCGSAESICKDHIKPIYQGGSDDIKNLQPLCDQCNKAKGPEVADFRPDGWQEAVRAATAERMLTDGLASPEAISHKPEAHPPKPPLPDSLALAGADESESKKNEGKERKPRRPAKPKHEESIDPRHHYVTSRWSARFADVHHFPCAFDGGRAGKALQRFLATTKEDGEAILEVAKQAWRRALDDPYAKFCKNASTISGLCGHWNAIRVELAKPMSKPNGARQSRRDIEDEAMRTPGVF